MNFFTKTLLITLIGLWGYHQTQAQITAIPDTTFEAYLISAGIDSDSTINGQVQTSDIDTIQYIFIQNKSIKSLEGIQDFAALVSLNIKGNQIDSLNLDNLQSLLGVNAIGTPLRQIKLANTPSLISLSLDSTLIDSIDISNHPSILTLRVNYCPNLVHINSTDCISLREIAANNSKLQSLTITNTPRLYAISCQQNEIQNINFVGTNGVEILNLNENQLTQLDLNNCQRLEEIYCRYNALTKVNFTTCPLLRVLSVGYNNIDSIDAASYPTLRSLYVSDNPLTYLNIKNSPNLDVVDCSHGHLQHILFQNNTNLNLLNCDSNRLTDLDFREVPNIQTIYARYNQLAHVNLKNRVVFSTNFFFNFNPSYLIVCVDNPSQSLAITIDQWATLSSICANTTLLGYIRDDANSNCQAESTELGIDAYKLTLTNNATNISHFVNTNLEGLYTGELDAGNYTIVIDNSLPYRSSCLGSQIANISSNAIDTIDWSVQTTDTCSYLEVSLSAPFLRATGGGSAYTVRYCNLGTSDAYNAYVEVKMDSALNVLSTSIPIQQQNGNTYTFDLDTVRMGTCHTFKINVMADTLTPLGHVLCSEAHIYPDSLCSNPWMGPIIQASSTCITDSVLFLLRNEGSSMSSPLQYSIFEDQVMLLTNPFTLGANGSTQVSYPTSPGKTYRIEAIQVPGIPAQVASPIAHSTIRDCLVDSTGVVFDSSVTAFFNENTTPFIDIDCQVLRAAYDPNDKAGQPLGYGMDHFIPKNIPINYKVRFQNTGNDTAFNIVIIDTLSTHVNATSLQMETSSHPYTWSLSGTGILTVTFADIKLVDSLTNEPLSHGFFTYTIDQNANLPIGTIINNQAAIYFDYNPPIFTNTTLHTIGENYYRTQVSIDNIQDKKYTIDISPNPFQHQTTLMVRGEIFETLHLEILDVTGRIIRVQSVENANTILLQRQDLLQGVYFYRLKGNNQLIGSGKIIAQ